MFDEFKETKQQPSNKNWNDFLSHTQSTDWCACTHVHLYCHRR